MDSRAEILARIRRALPSAILPDSADRLPPAPTPPPYTEPLADVFGRALQAVHGVCHQVEDSDAAREWLLAEFRAKAIEQVLCWDPEQLPVPGLGSALTAAGVRLQTSGLAAGDRKDQLKRLAEIEVGLTGAQAGLARSGSVILQADARRGRLPSLTPPVHYVLLPASRIYPDLPDWISSAGVGESIARSSNTVIITGPSRTGDIAQTLTLGAHGPKEVHVIIW